MRILLLFLLLIVVPAYAHDTQKYSQSTLEQAEQLKKEMHKNCNKHSLWAYLTNEWNPTLLFAGSLLYKGITTYRSSLPFTITDIKTSLVRNTTVVTVSSVLLLSCMVYKYYKPLFINLYSEIRGSPYEKKEIS